MPNTWQYINALTNKIKVRMLSSFNYTDGKSINSPFIGTGELSYLTPIAPFFGTSHIGLAPIIGAI